MKFRMGAGLLVQLSLVRIYVIRAEASSTCKA